MDGCLVAPYAIVDELLQWGHGREAMDGRSSAPAPRPSIGFNGATAVRPWMALAAGVGQHPNRRLQWGHGREAMDGGHKKAKKRKKDSFNGATAVRPWMVDGGGRAPSAAPASMGPRP